MNSRVKRLRFEDRLLCPNFDTFRRSCSVSCYFFICTKKSCPLGSTSLKAAFTTAVSTDLSDEKLGVVLNHTIQLRLLAVTNTDFSASISRLTVPADSTIDFDCAHKVVKQSSYIINEIKLPTPRREFCIKKSIIYPILAPLWPDRGGVGHKAH